MSCQLRSFLFLASAVRWVYEWEGSETVPYNYQSSHPVQGTNADGQVNEEGSTASIL